jgi:phosphoenolpyruvate carboxykinase (ATP)
LAPKFEVDVYKRFADNLKGALRGKNVREITLKDARREAVKYAVRTKYGSYCWRSAVSSRMKQKTLYLGSEAIQQAKLNEYQEQLLEAAPEMLHKTLQLVQTLPMVHIRRRLGDNPDFNPICNLYVSVADPKNWRLPLAWGTTLFDPPRGEGDRRRGPELTMIHIPDEHPIRMQILTLPEQDINIGLGTDYTGEDKKGFLRQSMYRADALGMLGLHAGTKIVTAKDAKTGELKRYGVFLFGLTATGKSTWSCHQLGLDPDVGEGTLAVQDDICFLRKDGGAYGSENNFYVKTDVDEHFQEAMYNALVDESAILENVMVRADGTVDFLDERLGENGRGVMQRSKLCVRRKGRLHSIAAGSINLPALGEGLDGVVFAFITRRSTIMPFAQELTPEQAVLAYLWGESTHSFATQPELAGQTVRTVGTDPFIIGPLGGKVNQFHDIVMTLAENYPGRVRFFQYNTGGMGEILKQDGKRKTLVRKVERVPISLMAAIQRSDLRGKSLYRPGRFGTNEIALCEDDDLKRWRAESFYSEAEIQEYLKEIVDGRRAYTERIAAEKLRPEIVRLAERSFEQILPRAKSVAIPREITAPPELPRPVVLDETRAPIAPAGLAGGGRSPFISPWEPRRPPRPMGRWK